MLTFYYMIYSADLWKSFRSVREYFWEEGPCKIWLQDNDPMLGEQMWSLFSYFNYISKINLYLVYVKSFWAFLEL